MDDQLFSFNLSQVSLWSYITRHWPWDATLLWASKISWSEEIKKCWKKSLCWNRFIKVNALSSQLAWEKICLTWVLLPPSGWNENVPFNTPLRSYGNSKNKSITQFYAQISCIVQKDLILLLLVFLAQLNKSWSCFHILIIYPPCYSPDVLHGHQLTCLRCHPETSSGWIP